MISNATAALIFQGLSVLCLLWLLYLIARSLSVRNWVEVDGLILESDTEVDADLNTRPRVRYRFEYRGREYTSSRILPHGQLATTSGNYARKQTARFPAGARITVYVQPDKPELCALQRNIPVMPWIMMLIGIFAFWFMGEQIGAGKF